MRILVVVDVQRDFCPGGALAVQEGDKVVPKINDLIRQGGYDLILYSQDWHPADHVSFASNHPGGVPFQQIDMAGGRQMLWPVHCVQNTPGAAFHPGLLMDECAIVVQKGTDRSVDSYSAYQDNDRQSRTTLLHHLETAAAIHTIPLTDIEVDVVGLALDYCVKATALDLRGIGLPTSVLFDATRAVDDRPEAVMTTVRELVAAGVAVIESKDRLPQRGREIGRNLSCEVQP